MCRYEVIKTQKVEVILARVYDVFDVLQILIMKQVFWAKLA
jgi:hypothetical protein